MRITKNRSVCWSSNVFCCQMSQHLYFCNLYKAFQKHNFVALVCDEWNVHIWQINYVQKHWAQFTSFCFLLHPNCNEQLWPILLPWFITWKEKGKDNQSIDALIPGNGRYPKCWVNQTWLHIFWIWAAFFGPMTQAFKFTQFMRSYCELVISCTQLSMNIFHFSTLLIFPIHLNKSL